MSNLNIEYNFQKIESKWQNIWKENNIFYFSNSKKQTEQKIDKQKKYIFAMCYYPSGRLHMGHVRLNTITDIICRGYRAKDFNVLNVMSADAFGLPAENAAIQNQTHPKQWTYQNIDTMNAELKLLGFSFDWSKFFRTCDEEYYKYQQEFFIKFYEKNIAYQKESFVNWDPVDKTVLSNEQVSADGKGWRSGALVEKKKMTQWFFRISNYSEELLQNLKELQWTEKVKKMQENWIGKSEGCEINFELDSHLNYRKEETQEGETLDKITVYTTKPETIFGVSAILISPNHEIAKIISQTYKEKDITNFIKECNIGSVSEVDISKKEKIGLQVKFTINQTEYKLSAIHPFTKKKLPVYIANYILDYGTGAVMSVPEHDERDKDFTDKYNLHGNVVINENNKLINSDFLNDLNVLDARRRIIEEIEKNNIGCKKINYKLRDWCISRQRYWGCPIPIVYCDSCGTVAEKIENLPIKLPDDVVFNGEGNPLEQSKAFIFCKCPKCGKDAKRETDTMDTYVESSWYFLKQISNIKDKNFDLKDILDIMPTDLYLGGPEHATTHMLYARFFMKALRDCGFFDDNKIVNETTDEMLKNDSSYKNNWKNSYINKNCFEPFKSFITTGMVCHDAYKDNNGIYYNPEEVEIKHNKAYIKNSDRQLEIIQGIKMSKSKKNTIQPVDIVSLYGADATRFFIISDNPIDNDFDWKSNGIENVAKYLSKIFIFFIENKDNFYSVIKNKDMSMLSTNIYQFDDKKNLKLFYQYLSSFDRYEFNVCIAKFREIMNNIISNSLKGRFCSIFFIFDLLKAIMPIIPHFSEELIERLEIKTIDNTFNINENFPIAKEDWNINEKIIMPIQINGKIKLKLNIENNLQKEEVLHIACKELNIDNKNIKSIIFIPNKILNIVLL